MKSDDLITQVNTPKTERVVRQRFMLIFSKFYSNR